MRKHPWIACTVMALIFTFLLAGCFPLIADGALSDSADSAPQAVQGVMDLTGVSFDDRQTIPLSGEWEFYWNQLLEPADFKSDPANASQENKSRPFLTGYLAVPGSWEGRLGEEEITGHGSGTYRLLIKIDPADKIYGIRVSNIRMSHRLFVNGQEAGKGGMPGIHASSTTMRNVPYPVTFYSQDGQIEILIQVADHNYISGGILLPITFGSDQAISRENQVTSFYDVSSVAALVMTALYYIGIILFRRKDQALFYFAVYCLAFAVFLLLHNEKILLQLIPALDYGSMMQLKTAVLMLDFSGAALFFHSLSGQFLPRKALRFYLTLYVLYGAAAITLPLALAWRLEGIVYLGAVSQVLLSISLMIRSLFLRNYSGLNRNSILILVPSTILILFHGILVILNNSAIFQSRAIELITLVLFIFGMSLFLTKRYSDAYDAVESLSESLIQADRVKDEFLLNTSHELKTPLHGIINTARSLLDTEGPAQGGKRTEDLNFILQVAKRLSSMINDIIDFESIRSGSLRLAIRTFDLNGPVAAVLSVLKTMYDSKKVALILEIPRDTFYVKADENRVRQILFNLLGNALKHTPRGEVRVTAVRREHQIRVMVSDTGRGIPEEHRELLFERFSTVPGQHTGPSSGLGLPIARCLARQMGGDLWLESSIPDVGSLFCFTLPAGEMEVTAASVDKNRAFQQPSFVAEAQASMWTGGQNTPQEAYQILVVDDEVSNHKVIRDLFAPGDQGPAFQVLSAYDGRQALEALRQYPNLSLVLLDEMMPGISGFEVCRKIRESRNLLELPILLLTVKHAPEDVEAGLDAGANDFLSKPFDGRELRARADSLLQLNQALKQVKQSELALLQAQVNPHFLYNTLNSIAALCRKQPREAEQLTVEFANYLRATFDFKDLDAWIPLHKEMEHIFHYLNIEKVRYEDRIQVEVEIQEGLDPLIPPLILQPLVENAVKHGIAPLPEGGRIRIQIRRSPDGIAFLVEDSGIGMSQQKLRTIRSSETDGIGVWNINRRLQNLFGTSLNIDSREGEGTRVSFLLPDLHPNMR